MELFFEESAPCSRSLFFYLHVEAFKCKQARLKWDEPLPAACCYFPDFLMRESPQSRFAVNLH